MTKFQKIAVGLLGFTHPEMFIPKSWTRQNSIRRLEIPRDRGSTGSFGQRGREVARVLRALRFALSALAIGSRTVPLADNSQLSRDLDTRARRLYGADED